MFHCVFCLIYELLECYTQEIAYPYIVEVLSCVDWFGSDMDWEILEESYYFAMHNSSYFSTISELFF